MPLFISGIVLFVFSCKSDLEKVTAFATELDLPEQSARNIEVEYTDTGKLQLKFFTPVLKHYTNVNEPYYEFPEGIKVYFYDENEAIQSIITANYSIYFEEPQLWEARDSVVARNTQTGEKIESEQMFWDQPKQLIYSKVFTKITNEDGTYFGEEGFEAAQDLSYYRLIGSSGTVRVKDEE
jgi:LPS export ABC transporter protein LptC